MKKSSSRFIQFLAFGSLVASGPSWALAPVQFGTITFAPVEVPTIPTLGGIGLLLLAALIGFMAISSFRKNTGTQRFTSLSGLAVVAMLSAAGGVHLVSESQALVPVAESDIVNSNGETLSIVAGENVYNNQSGVLMKVTEIDPGQCVFPYTLIETPRCVEEGMLEVGDSCTITCVVELSGGDSPD